MARRAYRQKRRAEAAETTRQRIVEATFALHAEKGIAATTMKQIAERAGVSVGTVYHHFPTYNDAIHACGAFSMARAPLPEPAIFDGAPDRKARVERLAAALGPYYRRIAALEWVRKDCDMDPLLADYAALEQRTREALAERAAGDRKRARALAAMLDVGVFASLDRAFPPEKTDALAAEMANAWLDRNENSQSPKGKKG